MSTLLTPNVDVPPSARFVAFVLENNGPLSMSEIVDAGVVDVTNDEQPRRYATCEIDLTVTTAADDRDTITPALIEAVARRETDADEARAVVYHCDEWGVTLMEAFMYRYHPRTERAVALAANELDDVRTVTATLRFLLYGRPNDVRLDPDLAGG